MNLTHLPAQTVLFVSTGGICRAPMAAGVFLRLLRDTRFSRSVKVDSAAISDIHVGDAPDPLAVDAASSRGYDIGNIRVRKVEARDFEGTTLLATDTLVLAFFRNMAPHGLGDRPRLLPRYTALGRDNIVDPFGGAPVDYHVAFNLIEASCKALMSALLLNRRL